MFPAASRRLIRPLLALLTLLAIGRVAMARTNEEPAKPHSVALKGFLFAPSAVVAAVGDTVIWTNEDIVMHTVTGDTESWDSGDLAPRKQFKLVIRKKGSMSYHCEQHPAMKGVITATGIGTSK